MFILLAPSLYDPSYGAQTSDLHLRFVLVVTPRSSKGSGTREPGTRGHGTTERSQIRTTEKGPGLSVQVPRQGFR